MVKYFPMVHRCRRIFALAVLSGLTCIRIAGARPDMLISVRDIQNLSDDDYAYTIPFRLTGLVTYAYKRNCFLETPEGSCLIKSAPEDFRVGDVIRASGFTLLDVFANDPVLKTTNVVTIGHQCVPEPPLLSIGDILSGKGDFRRIRIRGFLTDAFNDDIDDKYLIALFNVDGRILLVSAKKENGALEQLRSLVDADIEITGSCIPLIGGKRVFGGPQIQLSSVEKDILVLSNPAKDPFSAPKLKPLSRTRAENIATMKRHSVHGRVLAVWQKRYVLVTYGKGLITRLTLADGETAPRPGDWIDAVGFPETDLFLVNLANAKTRKTQPDFRPDDNPVRVSAERICRHPDTGRYDRDFHGRLVRLSGIVRAIPDAQNNGDRLTVECDGILVPVDAGTSADAFDGVQIGCRVETTGICIMEAKNWHPQHIIPAITGFTVVLRTRDDLRITARPSFLTPMRFIITVAILLVVLSVILIWNTLLRRLVERRSRELSRTLASQAESEMRIDERMRISAELHDYLAQNLTAVSYKLTSARAAQHDNPEAAAAMLESASAMLDSSRTELRHCLWDLKSKALEEPTFELALRRSLQQVASFENIELDFNIPRQPVDDPTAHAILSVIRELVANAVNHGLAEHITVQGEIVGEDLVITVSDNGCGFDVSGVGSSDDGHFGLDGIRQRVMRLNGAFTITSQPGSGTSAVIRIPHPFKS